MAAVGWARRPSCLISRIPWGGSFHRFVHVFVVAIHRVAILIDIFSCSAAGFDCRPIVLRKTSS
eukprot:scaffold1420_cov375-Pavlova_lutheri.AAC.16